MPVGEKPFFRERNVVKKTDVRDLLKFGLFFPNNYQTAMGGLTVKYLYHFINLRDDCYCERLFLPFNPNIEPSSMETGRKLSAFDILGVTTQFELDYMTLGWSLRKAGVPYSSIQRKNSDWPLVIAGGPCCTASTYPLLDIVDGYFFGDVENSLPGFLDLIDGKKENFFKRITDFHEISGFWSPHFLEISQKQEKSELPFSSLFDGHERFNEVVTDEIKVGIVNNLDEAPYPVSQVIPELPEWHPYAPFCGASFLLEIGRGCPHNCRFCMISHLFRPSRLRSLSKLLELAEEGIKRTGVKRVNLFGTNLSHHPRLEELCWEIVNQGYEISIATFRADKVKTGIVEALVKGGQTSVTIAPETGSDRLRKVINKKLTNEQVIEAASSLFSHPEINNVKLFFLTGLPTETEEDRDQLVELVKKVSEQAGEEQLTRVNVNPLIPKWQTPFMAWVKNWLPGNRESLEMQVVNLWNRCKRLEKVRPTFISFRKALYQTWLTQTRQSLISLYEAIPVQGPYHIAQSYKAFGPLKKSFDKELDSIWRQFSETKAVSHSFSCGPLKDDFYTRVIRQLDEN
ncbi:MAG: radical SAM protein [Candidatus Odinarchaeota archaeon]